MGASYIPLANADQLQAPPAPAAPMAPPNTDAGVMALLGIQPGMLPPEAKSGIPDQPPPGASLFERIMWRARRHLTGDTPPGYEAILGSRGAEAARPGYIDTFLGGARAGDYRKNLERELADRTRPLQIEQQLQQMKTLRDLKTKYAVTPDMSPEQVRQNLQKLYFEMAANGLPTEGMGAPVAEAIRAGTEANNPWVTANAGDQLYGFNKTTGAFAPGPQTGMNDDAKRLRELELELRQSQIAAALAQKNNLNMDTAMKHVDLLRHQFLSDNKDIVGSARPIELARSAFAQLRAGNTAAFKSSIIGFAGVADPKAQMRQGIIQMVEKLDPSAKGNFELAVNRIAWGRLPSRIITEMENLVEADRQAMVGLYNKRLEGYYSHRPEIKGAIETGDELFGGAVGGPTTNKVSKYLP